MHLSTLTIVFGAVGLVSSAAIPKAKRQVGSLLEVTNNLKGPNIDSWLEHVDVATPDVNYPRIIGVTGVVTDIFEDTAHVVTTNVDAVADGVNGAVEDIFDVEPATPEKRKRQLGSILDTTQKNGIPLLNEWIDTYDLTPLVNTPSIIDVPSSVVDIFSDEVSSTANLVTGTVDAVADGVNGAVEDIFDVEPAFPEER